MSTDLFSKQSGTYAQYRPTYPAALFAYLAPARKLAWDDATGNGQAAIDPTEDLAKALASEWGAPDQKRPLKWDLAIRVGHV